MPRRARRSKVAKSKTLGHGLPPQKPRGPPERPRLVPGPCRHIATPDPETEIQLSSFVFRSSFRTGGLCPNRDGQRGKLSLDPFIHSRVRQFGCHAHRILYGVGVRPAMPDYGNAAYAKQWRSAILGVVDFAPKLFVSASRKHVTHL